MSVPIQTNALLRLLQMTIDLKPQIREALGVVMHGHGAKVTEMENHN